MQERVMKHDKIEVLFEHNAVGLFGENGVEGVHLVQRMGEPDEKRYDVAIDGFFLAIGHKPNSDIFKPYVDTDEVGISSPSREHRVRKCRAYSPPETLLILTIVKPSPLPEPVARQPLKRKDTCLRKD